MQNYADLVREIDILKAEIEKFQLDLDYWQGKRTPLFSPGASKYGLAVASERVDHIYDRMEVLEARLAKYEELEKDIRGNIEQLEGLPYKIAKLYFIHGMSHQKIADELGYSHEHIRRVASKSKKREKELQKKMLQ